MQSDILSRIESGIRLSFHDTLELFRSDDIFEIGRLASKIAQLKNGSNAYFIVNRHINPTNICVNRCKFCAFSRSKGEVGSFELTIDQILERLSSSGGFSEVHIVGGLHPDWPFEHYVAMISAIRQKFPTINIKAFTAVEIDYFSRISGLGLEQVLNKLKDSGLQIMPGGGAEIFAEGIRNELCPEKISGERWREVMEVAHRVGIKTNATMLYGHLETLEDRIDHLLKLRELQDRTGGFQAFIPLAYHPKNTEIGGFYSSGLDDLKTIAISRLVLDNFDHIKAYWIMLGEKVSQTALLFGADDLDGTIIEEKITHMAGAMTGEGMTRDDLIYLIKKAGKTPVERDGLYNKIWKE
ncbi:MAG TPA: aminofutalosine synthase MqnE [Dissulfurispiraceae bacterium]|nr:aminofutalosine synthase MqnE [Dissulfurispiraceae bacterium]